MARPLPDLRAVDRARLAPLLSELDLLTKTLLDEAEERALASDDELTQRTLALVTRVRVELRLVSYHIWPELQP
jgi:hypothetical protein